MAVAQTMSNPSDWIRSYQTQTQTQTQTTTTTTQSATPTGGAVPSRTNSIPDQGRVSRPIRRRSRASRRTPTTLLNTDAANFRAMVQHFTGGPSTQQFPAGSSFLDGGAAANFGFPQHISGTAPGSGFYPNQEMQVEQYMYMINNMRGGDGGGGGSVTSHAPPGPSMGNENRNFDNYML